MEATAYCYVYRLGRKLSVLGFRSYLDRPPSRVRAFLFIQWKRGAEATPICPLDGYRFLARPSCNVVVTVYMVSHCSNGLGKPNNRFKGPAKLCVLPELRTPNHW